MFETAVVNEPSVFEPLKFYCMLQRLCNVLGWIRKEIDKVSMGKDCPHLDFLQEEMKNKERKK